MEEWKTESWLLSLIFSVQSYLAEYVACWLLTIIFRYGHEYVLCKLLIFCTCLTYA